MSLHQLQQKFVIKNKSVTKLIITDFINNVLLIYSIDSKEAVQSQYHCTKVALPSSLKSNDS